MKLFVKNMVCSRCIMIVRSEAERYGLKPVRVELGELEMVSAPSEKEILEFNNALNQYGFELIGDRRKRITEKVKNILLTLLQKEQLERTVNLSHLLTQQLPYEYSYLSNVFSAVEGITIEKYFIQLKIEKVKELLVYDELNLSEIAHRLGYSSVAYLSAQFKQVTGLTPSFFKTMRNKNRRNLEEL